MYRLAFTRNWIAQFNSYNKFENFENSNQKSFNNRDKNSDFGQTKAPEFRTFYYGLGMLCIIVLIGCLMIVSSNSTIENSPTFHILSVNYSKILNNRSSQGITRLTPIRHQTESSYYLNTPSTSTTEYQKPENTTPLKPPKIKSITSVQNSISKNISTTSFKRNNQITENNILGSKLKEYLLEREDTRPIYQNSNYQYYNPLKHKLRPKVKLQPEQEKHFNTQKNNYNHDRQQNYYHDQIPRPPRLNKTPSNRRHTNEYNFSTELEFPRPFQYQLNGPAPSEFRRKRPRSYPQYNDHAAMEAVNNIQEILNTHDDYPRRPRADPIHITGKYRHSKGTGITNIFTTPTRKPKQRKSQTKFDFPRINTPFSLVDPLYPYKPRSPGEVNLLATPQRHKLPKRYNKYLYEQSHTPDLETTYQKIIAASNYRKQQQQLLQQQQQYLQQQQKYLQQLEVDESSRKGSHKPNNKPFSLMLDIYPMSAGNEDTVVATTTTLRPKKVKKPYPPTGISGVNNLPYQPLDNSYYNSMNFHQLPMKFSHQLMQNNVMLNSQDEDDDNDDEENQIYYNKGNHHHTMTFVANESGSNNPSQILVHLNLFPKKKPKNRNNVGSYEIINRDYIYNDRIDFKSVKNSDSNREQKTKAYIEPRSNFNDIKPIGVVGNLDMMDETKNSKGHNTINDHLTTKMISLDLNKSGTINSTLNPTILSNSFKLSKDNVVKFNYSDILDKDSGEGEVVIH